MPGPWWAGTNSVFRDSLIPMYQSSPCASLIIDPSMRGDRFAAFLIDSGSSQLSEFPTCGYKCLGLLDCRSWILSP